MAIHTVLHTFNVTFIMKSYLLDLPNQFSTYVALSSNIIVFDKPVSDNCNTENTNAIIHETRHYSKC